MTLDIILWKTATVLTALLSFVVLGFGGLFTLYIALYYGYIEFQASNRPHKQNPEPLPKNTSGNTNTKGTRFIGRFFRCAYIPLLGYCALIYVFYQISSTFEGLQSFLAVYFDSNEIFHLFSGLLYKTISTHYAAVAPENPLRAEMLVQIYAVVFNSMVLLPLVLLPSAPVWVKRIQAKIDIKQNSALFIGWLFMTGATILAFYLYHILFDLASYKETRRLDFDVSENDKFLWILLLLSSSSFFVLILGATVSFSYLKALLSNLRPHRKNNRS